uniref:hypothetical protein n=1 Tax=Ruminococcus sp. TaxID=41978 RepID=UPI003AB116C5
YVKYNRKYSEAALGKSDNLLRIAEIQKLLKIILDNRDIAYYNKSTTGTQKPETTKGRLILC